MGQRHLLRQPEDLPDPRPRRQPGLGRSALGGGPTIAVGPGSGLPAVSCGLTFCMAVGHQKIHGVRHSLTELWDGNGWILQQPVDPF